LELFPKIKEDISSKYAFKNRHSILQMYDIVVSVMNEVLIKITVLIF